MDPDQNSDTSLLLDAASPIENFRASDGIPSMRILEASQILENLGLSPDMTVQELQTKISIANRVLGSEPHAGYYDRAVCGPTHYEKNGSRTPIFTNAVELHQYFLDGKLVNSSEASK